MPGSVSLRSIAANKQHKVKNAAESVLNKVQKTKSGKLFAPKRAVEGEYTEVEAQSFSAEYYASDGDWYCTLSVSGIPFYFDVITNDPSPLNGTYTYDQMDPYYSWAGTSSMGWDYLDATLIVNADASEVEAYVTLDDESKYHITYVKPEIPEITDYKTFEFTVDQTELGDYTAGSGVLQIQGDNGEQYVSVAFYANELAGTYTIDDLYLNYTILYVDAEDNVGVLPFDVNATVTEEGATVVYDGYDGVEYTLKFTFPQNDPVVYDDPEYVTRDANGIITAVDGGEARVYARATNAFYAYVQNSSIKYSYQGGNVDVVVDGDDWYIKDIICNIGVGTWVKGTLSEDGTKLVVPAGQLIYWSTYGYGMTLNMGVRQGSSWTMSDADITYSINGNTLTLDGCHASVSGTSISFQDNVLGAFWTDDKTWAGYGEWNSVLTYDPGYVAPSTDLVELPDGATTEEWHMNATSVLQAGNQPITNQAVNVAFVDNDVYVQGIFAGMFPTAWIKGTIDGTNITFANVQYLGKDTYGDDTWAQGYTSATGLCDFTATYDAESKTITGTVDLLANCDVTRVYYDYRYTDIVIYGGEVEEPIITELTAELPYFNGFDTADEQEEAQIYDANYDGKTFKFANDTKTGSTTARYSYNTSADGDDYVVFPGLSLEAGKSYKVSVDARSNSASYPERLEIVAGTIAKASDLNISILAPTDIASGDYVTLSATFTPEADGVYYFAIHAISDADMFYLYTDNFSVAELCDYSRDVVEGDYGTICLPGAVAADDMNGAEFFSIASIAEDGTINLTDAVSELEAGKPYIFKATAATLSCANIAMTETAPVADAFLTGVFVDTEAEEGTYVMQKHNGVLGFYQVDDVKPTVKANHAYLTVQSNARVLTFGGETAISNVKVENSANAAIYNMAGQRVSKAEKGIFIINGKKVIK